MYALFIPCVLYLSRERCLSIDIVSSKTQRKNQLKLLLNTYNSIYITTLRKENTIKC